MALQPAGRVWARRSLGAPASQLLRSPGSSTATAAGAKGPRKTCLDSFAIDPQPMYSDVLDLALLFSAKAGCTFAVKWLYYQEELLDEARAYSPWPHDYRQQVYCKRPRYSEKTAMIPELGPRAIKFVRNPFDRAVGSYLFYSVWAQKRDVREHVQMLDAIGVRLRRPVGDGQLFSFREFVDFLASLDLDKADIHVRRQISLCERLGQLPELTIIRIEESAEALPRLEDDLGLRRSDLAQLRDSSHHTKRADIEGFVGDKLFDQPLSVAVPRSIAFYDDRLTAQVARMYAEDIEAYGYANEPV